MRRIFLFWIIILIVLAAGIGAIVYGKILVRNEKNAGERLFKE